MKKKTINKYLKQILFYVLHKNPLLLSPARQSNESNPLNTASKVNKDCTEMNVRTRAQRSRSNAGCSTNTSNSYVSRSIEEKETYLLHHGITVQQCSRQEYMVHISRSTSFQGYFLMITTIPRDFKHTEIDDFIAFIKIAMKASAYVILFTQFQCLSEWMNKLLNAGFDVMKNPFVVTHSPEGKQERAVRKFPQCTADFALIATVPSG